MSNVYLPLDKVPQKLDRNKLEKYNTYTKKYFSNLKRENKLKSKYIIKDGPPYANNDFHLGHLLNKTLKDILVKRKLLEGYNVEFRFGFDCHGLPIELRAKGNLEECKNIVKKYSVSQTKTSNKFGIFSYTKPYYTSDEVYKKKEISLFNKLLNKGYIYKDKKIVWYSPSLSTVLANSQIIYKELNREAIIVKIVEYLVYTTNEWTLAKNQGIGININDTYCQTIENFVCSLQFAKDNNLEIKKVLSLDDFPDHYLDQGIKKPIIKSNKFEIGLGTGIIHLSGGYDEIDKLLLESVGVNPETICEKDNLGNHIKNYKTDYLVFKRLTITHKYPTDDRIEDPVYQILANQYFVDINLHKIKKSLKNINLSSKNRDTLYKYISDRPYWCISRQRKWGVQIPNEEDILDVWFDSGCSWLLDKQPADIYLEGIDQYRGWFQSSVILSSLVNKVCTKKIFSHGFIVDEYDEKLSKSKGNFTAIDELYDKYGPDVLRLWICLSDYKTNVKFSKESIDNASKQYFKIRNWLRYFRNNIYSNEQSLLANESLVSITEEIKSKVKTAYDEIDYGTVFKLIFKYIQDYSSSLTEEIKNTFYESELTSYSRLKLESEMHFVLKTSIELLYPILPFLCSEIKTS